MSNKYFITEEELKKWLKQLGKHTFEEEIVKQKRCTGRTLSLILKSISDSIMYPDTYIPLVDTYDGGINHKKLMEANTKEVINKLGLRCINVTSKGLIFKLYEVNPRELL